MPGSIPRSPRDWVTALRAVGAGANADMRTDTRRGRAAPARRGGPGRDRGGPRQRGGRADGKGSPADRDRIRIAAETTAAPKLRIALEKASASDIDEEELGAVLAELEVT